MNVKQMRETIRSYYTSKVWTVKVEKMTDSQVMAIFFRWKQENKI